MNCRLVECRHYCSSHNECCSGLQHPNGHSHGVGDYECFLLKECSRAFLSVAEFHHRFDVPILDKPTIPLLDRRILRITLIEEELEEFKVACEKCDIVSIADALADLIYVIYGASLEYGIPLDDVVEEVHRSNMTKIWSDGKVHQRSDGKVLKPPTYSPPNLRKVLGLSNDVH